MNDQQPTRLPKSIEEIPVTARKRVVDNRTPTYASAIVRLLDAFDGLGSDAERLVLAAHAESLTGIQK